MGALGYFLGTSDCGSKKTACSITFELRIDTSIWRNEKHDRVTIDQREIGWKFG